MTIDRVNLACGAFLVIVGALFAHQSLQVELGSWVRIGSGGLPLVLSCALIVIGVLTLIAALRTHETDAFGSLSWRGLFFILLAPILFGLTVRGMGFIGSVFIASAVASFASVRMKPHYALALAIAVTFFSTLVFSYGLGLPIERIGPWLRF